ncbi:MAG: DUF6048 family protein [Bacteroidota bacterium]
MCRTSLSISLVLWLLAYSSFGQTPSRFKPSGVRIGTDLLGIGYSIADRKQFRYEINGDIDIHKYFLTLDYGFSRYNRADTMTYHNDGHYFRIGADINLLKPDEFGNVVFLGLRYGHSFFNDDIQFTPTIDQYYGAVKPIQAHNNGIQAQWGEVVFGVKVQVIKQFYLGFTGRYKMGMSQNGKGDFGPAIVPGYGTASQSSTFGFNYQLFYLIKWREKPLFVKPPKPVKPRDED